MGFSIKFIYKIENNISKSGVAVVTLSGAKA